jgi:hypothetical protein
MTGQIKIYQDTIQDIEKTLGSVPRFMKFFPREELVRDWPSWKCLGEIDLERARYLLNTDELQEEMLGKLVDINTMEKTGEVYLPTTMVSECY